MLIALGAVEAKRPTAPVHRIMSANIRITGLAADDVDGRRWDDRKEYLIEVIRNHRPDVVMMQEVIYDSYEYCRKNLKDYIAFGFEGPEMDPYTEGYHLIGKNVIFVRRDRYQIVAAGCYWLSDDPVIGGSIAWGTNRARHCNWLRVKDRKTGRELRLLDIHLDHKVQEAKIEQAKLVVREAAQYADSFPQIICADFNSKKWEPQVCLFIDNGWHDLYDELHDGKEFGYTAHAFLGANRQPKPNHGRIDYILSRGAVRALSCEVLTDNRNGLYPSDHYFLLAEVVVE